MKLIIVGGGKVAYYLVNALEKTHEITIIEEDEEVARKAANHLFVSVVHGDGTTLDVLTSADCERADMFVAVTGKDEVNLVACQVAKKYYHVPMTIARVNNPKNLDVMNRFGVDRVYSGTKILAEMIEQEIEFSGIHIVHEIQNSDRVLCEFILSPHSAACEKTLLEYDFVKDVQIGRAHV